ncbi:phage integrase N-terminal SAM-like domain-containing protein [Pseudonocardia acaciae]|uniref:phage integrase N-terminal SAM-like domain-containing protein n=1 Tax=Pseudonocardia acaciae TaxID=551276 RepID=UPI0009FE9561|nr:phage integrase N-terminal SAM-like domain-containing protein [Pseudonocardia acaciae]
MTDDAGLAPALRDWRSHLHARRLSPTTISGRVSAVRRFQRFAGDSPWNWHSGDIERYVCHLRETGRTPSTIRAYVAAVREFRSYVVAPRPAGTVRARRFAYADYLLAIGYTEGELQGLVSARPEE